MNWSIEDFFFNPYFLGVNVFLLLVLIPHLRSTSGVISRVLSSIILLVVTAFVVISFGSHRCNQGGSPPFLITLTAFLAAGMPWLLTGRMRVLRGVIVLVVASSGMILANYLTSSYHRDDITGNPDYSSGRFWHTTFTGQYPREQDKSKLPRKQSLSEAMGYGYGNSEQGTEGDGLITGP